MKSPGEMADRLTSFFDAVSDAHLDQADWDVANEVREYLESLQTEARFEVYTDTESEYRWRLVHRNGNIIADSGQGYSSKQKAMQGLTSVKKNALDATVYVPVEDAGTQSVNDESTQ